jgi:hypothetical protein
MTPRKPKPPLPTTEPVPVTSMRTPDVRNKFPDMLELRAHLQPPNDPTGSTAVNVELRVYEGAIDYGDLSIKVSFAALMLAVDQTGFDPAPGPRFGEPTIQNSVAHERSTTVSQSNKKSLTGRLAAGLSILAPKAEVSVSAEADMQKKIDEKIIFKETVLVQHVQARPNLKWEVQEPDRRPLKGSYLTGETLCSLNQRSRANQVSVSVKATVKQKDIVFDRGLRSIVDGNNDNTRNKLLNIFLAKAMSEDPAYAGSVTLSQVDIEPDDH